MPASCSGNVRRFRLWPRRDRRPAARERARRSRPTRSRRAPTRSTAATAFPAICGPRSARSACTASRSRRNGAAPGSAISSTASRWRKFRARPARSGCPTARIPISASTRSACMAARSRSAATCRKLISGEHVGALAMSEVGAGSDVASMTHARRQEGRPLRSQRHQDVDHQRPACRHAGGLCQDRSRRRRARHHGVPDREGLQGLLARAEARQARHARLRHLRAGVRGLRGAGGQRARRGRRRLARS